MFIPLYGIFMVAFDPSNRSALTGRPGNQPFTAGKAPRAPHNCGLSPGPLGAATAGGHRPWIFATQIGRGLLKWGGYPWVPKKAGILD